MNWKEFWYTQTTPLHAHNDEKWYRLYAEEINQLCKALDVKSGAVLDSGCGNGALFDYYDFVDSSFTGVDFSEGLLKIFREKHPELNLVEANAADYIDSSKYSLVLSNGVIQYFEPAVLEQYINNSLNMLSEDGVLLMCNIPNKLLRTSYSFRESSTSASSISLLKKAYIRIKLLTSKDTMGCWYRPLDFIQYADSHHHVHVFGSLYHPYRFSVAIKKLK